MPSSNSTPPVSPWWGVDDLLRFSDFESSSSDKKENLELSELEWLLGGGGDHVAAPAEVPQLDVNHVPNSSYRPAKSSMPPYKKARFELQEDDEEEEEEEEYFTVPDLG